VLRASVAPLRLSCDAAPSHNETLCRTTDVRELSGFVRVHLTDPQAAGYYLGRRIEPLGGAVARPTPQQALADIKGLTSAGRIFITTHARKRMSLRQITAEDIRVAIPSATGAEWNEEDDAWRVYGGVDLDGEETIVGVAIEHPGVRITTVF
jgi:hypothetical protein